MQTASMRGTCKLLNNILCVKFKIRGLFITTLLIQLYVRVDILLTYGKYLQASLEVNTKLTTMLGELITARMWWIYNDKIKKKKKLFHKKIR